MKENGFWFSGEDFWGKKNAILKFGNWGARRNCQSARLRGSGAKRGFLEIEKRGTLRCTAARIMFAFSIFGNCNLMCEYGVSTYNDPACAFVDACVGYRAYRPHGLHRSGSDRFSRSSLSLSLLHYARGLAAPISNFDTAVIIRCNRTSRSWLVQAISWGINW